MSEKAYFEPSLKRASHFVKIIVACRHRLPKLPESTLRKQARPNNGSLFYSHCHVVLTIPNLPKNSIWINFSTVFRVFRVWTGRFFSLVSPVSCQDFLPYIIVD
jgi:hypothetical protein